MRCKGTLINGASSLLGAIPGARALVNNTVQGYLDEPALSASWYPSSDYFELAEACIEYALTSAPPGQRARAFGALLARRDLAGDESSLPEDAQTGNAGTYRRLLNASDDVPSVAMRLSRLWSLYYDQGTLRVEKDPDAEAELRAVVTGVNLPAWHCETWSGYVEEVGRLKRAELRLTHPRCMHRGHDECEWRIGLPPTEPVIRAMTRTSSLPPAPD